MESIQETIHQHRRGKMGRERLVTRPRWPKGLPIGFEQDGPNAIAGGHKDSVPHGDGRGGIHTGMHASPPRKPRALRPIGRIQHQQTGAVETQDFLLTAPRSRHRGTISGFVGSGLPQHPTVTDRKSHHAGLRAAHLND